MTNDTLSPVKIDPFLLAIRRIELELNSLTQELVSSQQELEKYSKSSSQNEVKNKSALLDTLQNDLKAYQEADRLFLQFSQSEDDLFYIKSAANNIVSAHIDYFSSRSSVKMLTSVAGSVVLGVSIHTLCADRRVMFPDGFKEMRNIITAFAGQLSKYAAEEETVLLLISYHLLTLSSAEIFSKQWVNKHPEFEGIQSKDDAIRAYVELGLRPDCNDSFCFACWVYTSGLALGNLMWASEECEVAIASLHKIKVQKEKEDATRKAQEQQKRGTAIRKAHEQQEKGNADRVAKEQQEMEKAQSIVNQANKWLTQIANTPSLYADIENIMLRFVNENLTHFSNAAAFLRLEDYILDKANLCSNVRLPFTKAEKPVAGQRNIYFHPAEKARDKQLDLLVLLLKDYIDAEEPIIWIVCYQLIVNTATTVLARHWENRFPKYEKIESKEDAVKSYVSTGLSISDYEGLFQLSCWICYNHNDDSSLADTYAFVEREVVVAQKRQELEQFKAKMLSQETGPLDPRTNEAPVQNASQEQETTERRTLTIEDIDKFSGVEFERFVGSLFAEDGYEVEYTQATNDKGIDVIAQRKGKSIGIQCKCYSSTVGLSAVQEAFSGKSYYSLDKAMVITNNYFTKAAIDTAKATGVILWNRDVLKGKVSLL